METSITDLGGDEIYMIHGGASREAVSTFVVTFFIGLAINHYGNDAASMPFVKKAIEVLEDLTMPAVLMMAAVPVAAYLLGRTDKTGHRSF